MAEKKFSELAATSAATLADIYAAVQSGSNVQITGQQLVDLARDDIILSYAGDPNGNLAGETYEFCWDTTNSNLYICTTDGTSATAVWSLVATALDSDLIDFLQTPTSANLASAVTDETGSGSLVFNTSPDIATPDIDGGTLDDCVIGGSTPNTADFTDVNASGKTICGDPGTEASGININGTTYESKLKTSNIGAGFEAQFIMHRHSTTLQPLIVGARSNSNTDSHTAITSGQSTFTIYGAGWTGSHYDLFGAVDITADTSGTIGATSSPGRIRLLVTADSSNTPAAAVTISNDKSVAFAGDVDIGAGSNTFKINSSTPDIDTILDEDTMSSDSDTALATQQSIKAYVDSTVAASFVFNNVTGTSQTMVAGEGYIANNGALVTLTLPTTAAIGTRLAVVGNGAGGWSIAQNASQIIHVGSSATTTGVGGSVSSTNRYDSLELVCTVADTEWVCFGGPQGILTIA